MMRVLLLGGTTEASALARQLAAAGVTAVFSYAGRTDSPAPQPLPVRIGGFGGPEGLARYLMTEGITHVIDATHPFAATISGNAVAACAATGIPLCAHERAAWVAGEGDDWTHVADIAAAVAALPEEPTRIFLAIGRQTIDPFAAKPWHQYVLRLVDPPKGRLPLPGAEVIVARGPFDAASDQRLLAARRIKLIVAKNAGGAGARAKLDAARALRIPVVMIDRPALPPRHVTADPEGVMAFLGHPATLGV
ncbi:MAG: cobalt-precorrin-6A reductase [Alphaproteobacteria bacterium HGW-Alphaproteobacteria-6]|nr:MAG: cobalt-precorrin-6A reductase [Alphaproteobacteria bacterium HGW-Alphaproteobacteria-6]